MFISDFIGILRSVKILHGLFLDQFIRAVI